MLNYTKTVFINKPANVRVYVSGAAGTGVIKDGNASGLSSSLTTAAVPTTKLVVKGSDELWIDANHTVKVVAKTPYKAATNANAVVTLPSTTGNYRLAVYIRLRNNNSSMYSNDWTFKGKPFYVEFKGKTTAELLKSLIDKYQIFEYGKKLINVSVSTASTAEVIGSGTADNPQTPFVAGAITLTATDQWQVFMTQDSTNGVAVEKLVNVGTNGYSSVSGPNGEEWQSTSDGSVTITNGNEAFGDFAHIAKDLRLPTGANLRWQGIAVGDVYGGEENDDKPSVNGKYTQYTIEYDSERGIGQQSVLGGVATSRTTHVFYVESAATAAFDAAIVAVGAKAFEGALSHTATLGNVTVNGLKTTADANSDGIIKGAELKTT